MLIENPYVYLTLYKTNKPKEGEGLQGIKAYREAHSSSPGSCRVDETNKGREVFDNPVYNMMRRTIYVIRRIESISLFYAPYRRTICLFLSTHLKNTFPGNLTSTYSVMIVCFGFVWRNRRNVSICGFLGVSRFRMMSKFPSAAIL